MKIRVVTANIYRKNHRLDDARHALVDTKADALLTQEATALGGVPGYLRHSGDKGHAREVAVYVRDDQPVLDDASWQMSADGGRAVSHARYAETVRLANGVSLMSTHMNADIKDHGRVKVAQPGTLEWVKHMRRIQRWCRKETRAGRHPVVGMDSNFYARSAVARVVLWWWSPQRALNRAGMTWHIRATGGMDGIAVPKGARVELSTVSGRQTGSDHPWIVADVRF